LAGGELTPRATPRRPSPRAPGPSQAASGPRDGQVPRPRSPFASRGRGSRALVEDQPGLGGRGRAPRRPAVLELAPPPQVLEAGPRALDRRPPGAVLLDDVPFGLGRGGEERVEVQRPL